MVLLALSALLIGYLLGLFLGNDDLTERLGFTAESVMPVPPRESQIESRSEREPAWQQTLREQKARLAELGWSMALTEARLQALDMRVQIALREAELGNATSADSDTRSAKGVDRSDILDSPIVAARGDGPAGTDFSESPRWFVHVAASQDRFEVEAAALRAETIIGMPLNVLEVETLGFVVRVCGLETQVRAQELVELLLKATRNGQLWIGRGC